MWKGKLCCWKNKNYFLCSIMKKNNCSFANSFIGKLISLLIFKAKFQKKFFFKGGESFQKQENSLQ